MNATVGFLAQLGSSGRSSSAPITGGWWDNMMNSGLKEAGIVIGILLVLAIIIAVVARMFYRKPTKKRATYPKYQDGEEGVARVDPETGEATEHRHRRHRRRKRSSSGSSGVERVRNPTLAETGGLPPMREPGQNPDL